MSRGTCWITSITNDSFSSIKVFFAEKGITHVIAAQAVLNSLSDLPIPWVDRGKANEELNQKSIWITSRSHIYLLYQNWGDDQIRFTHAYENMNAQDRMTHEKTISGVQDGKEWGLHISPEEQISLW